MQEHHLRHHGNRGQARRAPLNPVREIEILSKSRREPPRSLTEEEREGWFELMSQDERAIRADLIDISKFMLATGERIAQTLAVLWENVTLRPGRSTAAIRSSGSKAKA